MIGDFYPHKYGIFIGDKRCGGFFANDIVLCTPIRSQLKKLFFFFFFTSGVYRSFAPLKAENIKVVTSLCFRIGGYRPYWTALL